MEATKWTLEDLERHTLGIYDTKDQLKWQIYERSVQAFAAGDRLRDELLTATEFQQRAEEVRTAFIELLGGLPETDTKLRGEITGTVSITGLTIEQVIFESRPNTHVTASIYIPEGLAGPTGAVLFVCGHNELGRRDPRYQAVCQMIARSGLVVLAMDPHGQGERSSYHDYHSGEMPIPLSTSDHEQAGAQCWPLGDSLARYFLHDIIRAVDYLSTRPDVDAARIGITGNSGGGTQTSMAMLVERRLAAAAPATFIMDRESYLYAGQAQDAEQIWKGFSEKGFDHEDILLAMAPKPVLVLAAEYDFFPIEGTRRTVARARRGWEARGEAGRLALVEERCGHSYTDGMAYAAAAFFAEHLNGQQLTIAAAELAASVELLQPEQLQCTRTGQVRGDYPGEIGPCEINREQAKKREQARRMLPLNERRLAGMKWLKDTVYKDRRATDLNLRCMPIGLYEETEVESWLWWSQRGLFNHGMVFHPERKSAFTHSLVIAVWPRGTAGLASHRSWIDQMLDTGKSVMVLDVSGEGAIAPNPISPGNLYGRFETIHKLATDLLFLGDSLAAMRTFDLLRAIEAVCLPGHIAASAVEVYGEGRFSAYVELAAAISSAKEVTAWHVNWLGEPHGYAEWINHSYYNQEDVLGSVLPDILEYFDLPELASWRRVT